MMKTSRLLVIVLCFAMLSVLSGGCVKNSAARAEDSQNKPVLSATSVSSAPKVDGHLDSLWKKAPATKISLTAGKGVEPKEISLKALYDKNTLYLLAVYPDKTPLKVGEVWEFDGVRWEKGPYDDTLAFLWDINKSLPGFEAKGLGVMTTSLTSERDVFDFAIDDPGQNLAKATADFWGW